MNTTALLTAALAAMTATAAASAPGPKPMTAITSHLPACPPADVMAKQSKPMPMTRNDTLPTTMISRIRPEKTDVFISTKPFDEEGIPMVVFVLRKPGPAAYAHAYGVCSAPWGEMVCGQADMKSSGAAPAPEVEIRLYKGRPIALFTDKSSGRPVVTGWTFNQNNGFQAICTR